MIQLFLPRLQFIIADMQKMEINLICFLEYWHTVLQKKQQKKQEPGMPGFEGLGKNDHYMLHTTPETVQFVISNINNHKNMEHILILPTLTVHCHS